MQYILDLKDIITLSRIKTMLFKNICVLLFLIAFLQSTQIECVKRVGKIEKSSKKIEKPALKSHLYGIWNRIGKRGGRSSKFEPIILVESER